MSQSNDLSPGNPLNNTIDQRLWKFNAYVIAAAGIIGVVIGLFALYHITKDIFRQRHDGSIAAAPKPPPTGGETAALPSPKLTISGFQLVRGTPVLYAAVTSREDRRVSYYSKTASAVRNYIFYDAATGSQRRLLPDDRGLIDYMREVRDFADGSNRKPTPLPAMGQTTATQTAPSAFLFTIIDKDTSGDGLLSRFDKRSLALARPDGAGLTRLAIPFDTLLGHQAITSDELVVMIRNKGKSDSDAASVTALHISLKDFKLLRQVEIES